MLERLGIGALKSEDRLLAVAHREQRAVAVFLRAQPGEKFARQRLDDPPLPQIRILRLVDEDVVGALVELEADPFAEAADAQQRPRQRDEVVEIGEPLFALRQRITFGKTAPQPPCRRQFVGQPHRGGGAGQAVGGRDDARRMVEAVPHPALVAREIGAHVARAGQETAAQFAEHRATFRGIGPQPCGHQVGAREARPGPPRRPARRDRCDIAIVDRTRGQLIADPGIGIARRQPERIAQVARARRQRRPRSAEHRRAARQEGQCRLLPQPPRELRRRGAQGGALLARQRQNLAEHAPLQRGGFVLLDRAKARQQFRLERKARKQRLAEAVDRLHPDRAAGTVDHRREQRPRPRHQFRHPRIVTEQIEVEAQRLQVEPQLAILHPHPGGEPFVDAMRHFGGARLRKGDAQYRLGRYAVEHQPQHARRQNLRLAGARRRVEPDMLRGMRGGALSRVERGEAGRSAHSLSPRPNHSSRRISWS